jgi:flagellar hook-associated protein 2
MSTSTNLAISGLASGFDWQSVVTQLAQAERAPEDLLRTQQTKINNQNIAYGSLVTELGILKNRVDALNDGSLFDSHQATVSNSTIASASAISTASLGTYKFDITQLATTAVLQGAGDLAAKLSSTSDVSGVVLSNAGFSTAVTAGTFTVNGKVLTIATSDTLQDVFNKISTATSGVVTASYDSGTDEITLDGSSPIVLGSAADTSNFLQVAKLYNNGTGSVSSATALGAIKFGTALNAANFNTPVSGGAGAFKINGVTINFNAATDTLGSVISSINNSSAGVTAGYDAINDRLTLTNKTTGDVGVALADVTGNFLAASGLLSGTLQRGKNLLYSINGGGQLVSQSNTITQDSSSIAGLSVTAFAEDTVTVTVSSDSAKIKTAIADFVAEYNKVQSLISSQTASSTDAKGVVTAGVLAGDSDIYSVAYKLRSMVFSQISGLSGTISQLAALGYQTNGNDNSLALSDSTTLDSALAINLTGVKDFFTNSTNGLAVALSSFVDSLAGDSGSLVNHQSTLSKQSTDIDNQVAAMERIVLANSDRLTASFLAMETAQAQINQQLTFLSQQTWGSSSSGK